MPRPFKEIYDWFTTIPSKSLSEKLWVRYPFQTKDSSIENRQFSDRKTLTSLQFLQKRLFKCSIVNQACPFVHGELLGTSSFMDTLFVTNKHAITVCISTCFKAPKNFRFSVLCPNLINLNFKWNQPYLSRGLNLSLASA